MSTTLDLPLIAKLGYEIADRYLQLISEPPTPPDDTGGRIPQAHRVEQAAQRARVMKMAKLLELVADRVTAQVAAKQIDPDDPSVLGVLSLSRIYPDLAEACAAVEERRHQ